MAALNRNYEFIKTITIIYLHFFYLAKKIKIIGSRKSSSFKMFIFRLLASFAWGGSTIRPPSPQAMP
jgi:hypothetical protein